MPAKTLSKKQAHRDKVAKVNADQLINESAITPVAPNRESLPNGWRWVKLGDVCNIINGKNQSAVINPNGKYPIYGSSGIFGYANEYLSNEGSTIVGRKGNINSPIYVTTKFWNVDTAFALTPNDKIDGKLLFYFCKAFNFHALDKSTTIPSLAKTDLLKIDISLPPLPEQHAIVSKIEELLSELEKGKQQLETAQQQLKIYKQAVLKWAFEGKLTNKDVKDGELPKGWRHATLGDVCENVEYGSAAKSKKTGKIPVLRMGNIQNGKFDWDDLVYTDDKEEIEKYLLKKNDVLFNRTNSAEWVGKTAIYKGERPAIFAGYLIRINRKEDLIDAQFLTYYLNSLEAKMYGDTVRSFGVNQSNINGTKLKTYPLRLPLLTEQQFIVQEIESRLSVCSKVEETITTSLAQAETLRQSILKKAFEGKLISQVELNNVRTLSQSLSVTESLSIAAEPTAEYKKKNKPAQIPFPKKIEGISTTDLHAGVLAMVIDAHEKSIEHRMKLSHVKGEKIAHLVEAYIGIELGRIPQKDAAGPDDFPHLKKVESRAIKSNWFGVKKLKIGQTYVSKSGMPRIIQKLKASLSEEDFKKIETLVHTFLPFELEHAEVIAAVYAGWNNLLLEGKTPTDEEIVYESRENWSKRKLSIERASFFKALKWMREHGYEATGIGKRVTTRISD